MGYLFLFIALFCGVTKGYCGKRIGGYAENVQSATVVNLVRMLLCILFSLIIILVTGDISKLSFDPYLIGISALSGVSTSVFVITWLIAVKKSAYMMLDVFLMTGILIPVVAGQFLFLEPVTPRQWIGFFILLVAVILMCSYNNKIKTKLSLSSLLILLLSGIANGILSVSQKLFAYDVSGVPTSVFNLYTYVFASVTLAVFFLIIARKEKPRFEAGKTKTAFVYIGIMAAALTANSLFRTMAAFHLDSAILYPLEQGSALILSSLMASIFFGEKLTLKAILGIIIAFSALMIITL